MHLEQYFSVFYLYPLRIVYEAGEDDNAENEEEDQQHQLLGGSSEGLQEDLEAAGVPGQLEQPQDPNDAEELEDVRILDVGHEVLEDEVGVEADGGHEVNNIDGGLEEITFVRTTEKPEWEVYISSINTVSTQKSYQSSSRYLNISVESVTLTSCS